MSEVLTTALAYLLGSIPFGYLIVRWLRGVDIRRTGSGFTGATNVMRNLGWVGGFATLALDAGKGAGAVWLAERMSTPQSNNAAWIAAAGVAAILGHCFPVWLKFRGGKGLATGAGIFLIIAPILVGVGLLILLSVAALTRYVAAGSIVAVASFPVLLYALSHPPAPLLIGTTIGAAIIIAKHQANIRRMLNGTEKKLWGKSAA